MGSRWELFKLFWRTEDDDSPVTDASLADDSIVEDAILQAQEQFKNITDILVSLSAARTLQDDLLRELRESVTLAYNSALSGDLAGVKNALEQVVGK